MAVLRVKLGQQLLEQDIVSNITAFFVIFIFVFISATTTMCFFTPDFQTAASSVAATLGNIGPGFGVVGPMVTYSSIPAAGKAILAFCMLLGRLELYTVLVLFLPSIWRK